MTTKIHYIFLSVLGSILCLSYVNAQVKKGEKNDLILQNNSVRLVFADSSAFLMKEFFVKDHDLLSSAGSNTHPWQLTYRGPNGENPVLLPKFGSYKGASVQKDKASTRVTFTWDMLLTDSVFPINMTVTLKHDAELPEWRMKATLPKDWVITNLEYPRITFRRPENPKVILPFGYGVEYELGRQGTLQSRYPSCTATMQLVLMHNEQGALYYATQDKDASDKWFKIKSHGNNVTFYNEITASYGWTQDNIFTLPWSTVVGFSKEGWIDAVKKWYRPFSFTTEWGKKKIYERTNIADWIKSADLWLRPMGVNKETRNNLNKALDYFGKNIGIHWYYWHHYPFDTKYPEYFPYKEDFAQMVEEVQKKGNFVTPYINGRLWDTNTDSYIKLNGKEASCRKPDGTLYTEIYGSKVLNTVTCPASSIWQKVQTELVRKIFSDIKTSGVYIDQIGAAPSESCYAKNHKHPLGGGSWWHYAYRDLVREMRKEFTTSNQAITTEENAECYIDLFDMMLIVNTPHSMNRKIVPLLPLIYSDRAIYSGYTYIPWNIKQGVFKYMTMRSLLWGAQLGWIDPKSIMATNATEEAKFLKDLATFRRKNHDLFLGGRFLEEIIPEGDNPTMDIPGYQTTNVVLAAKWLSVTGRGCYIVVNMDNDCHHIKLPNNKQVLINGMSCLRVNL